MTVLVGIAYAAPIAAWGAHTENEASFVAIFRFVILPMFLFSGTFFPISELPRVLEAIAYLTPLWHGVDLCRQLMLGDVMLASAVAHVVYLLAWVVIGLTLAFITYRRRRMTARRYVATGSARRHADRDDSPFRAAACSCRRVRGSAGSSSSSGT